MLLSAMDSKNGLSRQRLPRSGPGTGGAAAKKKPRKSARKPPSYPPITTQTPDQDALHAQAAASRGSKATPREQKMLEMGPSEKSGKNDPLTAEKGPPEDEHDNNTNKDRELHRPNEYTPKYNPHLQSSAFKVLPGGVGGVTVWTPLMARTFNEFGSLNLTPSGKMPYKPDELGWSLTPFLSHTGATPHAPLGFTPFSDKALMAEFFVDSPLRATPLRVTGHSRGSQLQPGPALRPLDEADQTPSRKALAEVSEQWLNKTPRAKKPAEPFQTPAAHQVSLPLTVIMPSAGKGDSVVGPASPTPQDRVVTEPVMGIFCEQKPKPAPKKPAVNRFQIVFTDVHTLMNSRRKKPKKRADQNRERPSQAHKTGNRAGNKGGAARGPPTALGAALGSPDPEGSFVHTLSSSMNTSYAPNIEPRLQGHTAHADSKNRNLALQSPPRYPPAPGNGQKDTHSQTLLAHSANMHGGRNMARSEHPPAEPFANQGPHNPYHQPAYMLGQGYGQTLAVPGSSQPTGQILQYADFNTTVNTLREFSMHTTSTGNTSHTTEHALFDLMQGGLVSTPHKLLLDLFERSPNLRFEMPPPKASRGAANMSFHMASTPQHHSAGAGYEEPLPLGKTRYGASLSSQRLPVASPSGRRGAGYG